MAREHGAARPIGWWLKEADRLLDAAFDAALVGQGVDRRSWQVLASLGRGPSRRAGLVAALAPFDTAEAVGDVITGLQARRWVTEADGVLKLTGDGEQAHAVLSSLVAAVREQVARALPGQDYPTLIALLERLVTALGPRVT